LLSCENYMYTMNVNYMFKVLFCCICALLQSSNIAEKTQLDTRRKLALNQRSQLSDLYYGKNRPSTNCSCLYLVSADFVRDWKTFIRFGPLLYHLTLISLLHHLTVYWWFGLVVT